MFEFLKRKKKAEKNIFEKGEFNMNNIDVLEEHEIVTALMYMNDIVNIIYPACASCYGISKDKNTEYEQKLGYIGRRVKSLHTSILEHSNIVMQVYIPLKETKNIFKEVSIFNRHVQPELCDISSSDQDIMSMVSEVRDVCKYLTIYTDNIKDSENNPILRMTIGGSIRGYRYIFENIENRQNKLFISIFNVLKLVVPQEFFIDFINDEVMEPYNTIELTTNLEQIVKNKLVGYEETYNINIINSDSLILNSLKLKLPMDKCFDFISITVEFKHMSRIITQQVTRHRNGITQESQRYVDYSSAEFNSPEKFKDKYKDKKYKIDIFNDELSLHDIGMIMTDAYRQLVANGVEKEDARGFLPQNIQCGSLFMTFTLRSLLVFLDLRTDTHAQAEIQMYANELAKLSQKYATNMSYSTMKEFANDYSKPRYKRQEIDFYTEIDEEV